MNIEGQKLNIEASDTITYIGELDIPLFIDIELIKELIFAKDYKIISKTTSKMIVKVQVINLELKSEENIRTTELMTQLKEYKQKVIKLETEIEKLKQKKQQKWQEVNLAGTENFDTNCEYRIQMSNGYTCCPISITTTGLYHMFSSANVYYVSSGTKTKQSGNNIVTSIRRRKVI